MIKTLMAQFWHCIVLIFDRTMEFAFSCNIMLDLSNLLPVSYWNMELYEPIFIYSPRYLGMFQIDLLLFINQMHILKWEMYPLFMTMITKLIIRAVLKLIHWTFVDAEAVILIVISIPLYCSWLLRLWNFFVSGLHICNRYADPWDYRWLQTEEGDNYCQITDQYKVGHNDESLCDTLLLD